MSDKATGEGSSSELPPPQLQKSEKKPVGSVPQEWRRIPGAASPSPQVDELSGNSPTDGLVEATGEHTVISDSHRVLSPRELRKLQDKKTLMRERQKAREIHREALHSTRETITLVAILIATFTYTAGISPPGGVYQEGPLIGTPVGAWKTSFRVFSVCNNVALFTSLCVVLVLVSIIPFKRKALMQMLAIAHKAIWVAVSFMATAYVAAAVVVMQPTPRRRGMDWTSVFLMSICAGSLGTVFVSLGIMFINHRLMKRRWRKQQKRREYRQEREKSLEKHIQQEREKKPMEESDDDGSSTISDISSLSTSERGFYLH